MTAYLKWQGMSEAELSLYRGAGAISGLLATVVFPALHKRLGELSLNALFLVYVTAMGVQGNTKFVTTMSRIIHLLNVEPGRCQCESHAMK